MKKSKKPITTEELRRWCVEQAIRWPSDSNYGGLASGGGGYKPAPDIIDRADKILKWITND